MAALMTVLTEPQGMWESILGAFKGAMGSYILAVILLAVIVRILFAAVDVVNKRFNTKNMQINEKMKPELEAIQKKYGHDKVLLQKKQQEIYKKYQFNMVSSCLPVLIAMVLQLVVFLTLWTGLQNVSNYNIAQSYENTKTVYYNVLMLNENPEVESAVQSLIDEGKVYGEDYTISVEVDYDNLTMQVTLLNSEGEVYLNDDQTEKLNKSIDITPTNPSEEGVAGISNEEIYNAIKQYAMTEIPVEETPSEEPPTEETPTDDVTGEEEEGAEDAPTTIPNDLSDYNLVIKSLAEDVTADFYIENLESFLWIKNIYKAESPLTSPTFEKSEITNYLQKFYSEEEKAAEQEHDYEGQIFDHVVAGLEERDLGVNGYFILVILAVATSFLSIFINNKLTKKVSGTQAGGKMMYFIMPLILGIFTLMYTSLFAIYIIVGQIMMIALSPLTNFLAKKWIDASDKRKEKKKQEVVDVDYRRKDM